jgi:hypothetical protein
LFQFFCPLMRRAATSPIATPALATLAQQMTRLAVLFYGRSERPQRLDHHAEPFFSEETTGEALN